MAIWKPELDGRSGPKYLQIVEVLAEDIASGAVKPGTRLPPHRELAYQLELSPNTTSRAYAEGVARALIQGEVGRGTFVRRRDHRLQDAGPADALRHTSGPIDFSRNLPSPGRAAEYLADTLSALGRSSDLQALMDYHAEADLSHHAKAGIDWLRRSGIEANQDEVVVTIGAQHGIMAALMAITRPGDLLLTEALTYAPVKAMADRLGLKVRPVALDEGGLCPDALQHICKNHAAKALYFAPTLHTPTTITMTDDRRNEVAEVARRHDIILIEDDVFGLLKPDCPRPVATLAPERTLYVTSTSKCLAPGLRVGFVRAPVSLTAAIRNAVNLSCWMAPPLMIEITARWITDGTADRLIEMQRTEATKRQDIARATLANIDILADRSGFHLWLSLPPEWSAEAFRIEARNRDVKIVEAAAFSVAPGAGPNAVRLCLSHEPDVNRLRSGLATLADILQRSPAHSTPVL